MRYAYKLLYYPPITMILFLCVMIFIGFLYIFIAIKGLTIQFAHHLQAIDISDVAANLCAITLGSALFLYFANLAFCRVAITDAEVAYRSLFGAKTIKRDEIIPVHGGAESVERGFAHYTVKTHSKTIAINSLAFSTEQLEQMKYAIDYSFSGLQSADDWRA